MEVKTTPILFEEITFDRPRKTKKTFNRLRNTKKYSPQEPEEEPWYLLYYGEYPYSADVLDLLRAVPAGLFGGGVAAALTDNPNKAAVAGAVIGGGSDALLRTQLAIEYAAYDLAAPGQPVYHETEKFVEHQIFVGLLETFIGAGVGGLIGYLSSRR